MKALFLKSTGLFLALSLAFVTPSFADANEVVALQSKIDALNKKLSMLEKKLDRVESKSVAAPSYAASSAGAEGGLLHAAQDIQMGGYIDVQWNNNFRQPAGVTGTNTGRIFDTDDGSFTVNSAELYFENPAEEVGEAGFRIDLQFGEDAGVVVADGFAGDNIDLQQAYIEYIAPLSFFEDSDILPDSIKIQVGRFVTLAGLEVIEGPDNWNISRSYGFGFGLPFVHTGVRTNFGLWNDYFDVYVGVNNGYDNPVDNNGDKTLELAVGYEPLEDVSVFHAFYLGNENADGAGNGNRSLLTNVITWDATDSLSLMGAIDWGHEDNLDANNTSSNWYEFAAYARYQFTDKFAMAYRAELFVDEAVTRTGIADRLFGQTFTAEYQLADSLIARGEVRHDVADDDNLHGNHSSRTTLGAQLIYLI